jgi:hypothetical protein
MNQRVSVFAALVTAATANVVSFNDSLFHVSLRGTFPPIPSCILDRDLHMLTGTVDGKTGGSVRVHVVNGTIPDYELVFGPAIADRGFLVHNVTAKLPCNSSGVIGYAGCQDPSRGPSSACESIIFEDIPSPDVPPHPHWILTPGINPPPLPVRCNELNSQSTCNAARASPSNCRWCTSTSGVHHLCFTAGHTPTSGWTCEHWSSA